MEKALPRDAQEPEDIASVQPELTLKNIVVFELDGAAIHSREELFQAFAVALKMPKGWYGDEEYAPNAYAFLEYLDDVHEWVPAERPYRSFSERRAVLESQYTFGGHVGRMVAVCDRAGSEGGYSFAFRLVTLAGVNE